MTNPAQKAWDLLELRYEPARTSDRTPYLITRDTPRLAHELDDSVVADRLVDDYLQAHDDVPSSQAISGALRIAGSRCRQGPVRDIHLRIAEHRREIVIDLGDEQGRAVRIGAEGWRRVKCRTVTFRRVPGMTRPLVPPVRGGDLEELRDFIRVNNDQWPQLLAWMLCAHHEAREQPILLLEGPYGSGKTTASRFIQALLDPATASAWEIPEKQRDFRAAVMAARVLPFDNVTSLKAVTVDTLCRLVTGGGTVNRALWKNTDPNVTQARRAVIITSVNLGTVRPDLNSRLLRLELQGMDDRDRASSRALAEDFEGARGRLFGALCDLHVAVLAELPHVELSEATRLADFEEILAAVDSHLGTDGLSEFRAVRREQSEALTSADPWIANLVVLTEAESTITATPTALLRMVPTVGGSTPSSANAASARITSFMPELVRQGIVVRQSRTPDRRRQRLWHFDAANTQPDEGDF